MAAQRLPACLHNARNEAFQRMLAEADAAHPELADIRSRPAADLAAIVRTHLKFRRSLRLNDPRFLSQRNTSSNR
ncbi:hypothetical protein Cagg_3011 [Chloroflexus aggregans DSM 9485]|uniref:Uncharacterized protein n=1 Tax=Chloroflexus aggregans (strain MD-66 / DSM 9485) TaxID=326427 RepID=B8G6R2_CHLAD|nr:hypothetical protein Cagg_3011 [Chloroflexus aggregans DSM 9485]